MINAVSFSWHDRKFSLEALIAISTQGEITGEYILAYGEYLKDRFEVTQAEIEEIITKSTSSDHWTF